MRCPYQKIVIHKDQYSLNGVIYNNMADTTLFGECLKDECPFYRIKTVEHCRKAESEVYTFNE